MSARGDYKKFLKRVEKAGGVIYPGRGNHLNVYVNDVHIATISDSGNKGYSGDMKASIRALRQAGLKL